MIFPRRGRRDCSLAFSLWPWERCSEGGRSKKVMPRKPNSNTPPPTFPVVPSCRKGRILNVLRRNGFFACRGPPIGGNHQRRMEWHSIFPAALKFNDKSIGLWPCRLSPRALPSGKFFISLAQRNGRRKAN